MKWHIDTDLYKYDVVNFRLIRGLVWRVEKGEREFLTLIPGKLIAGSNFMQIAYEKDTGFLLEISLVLRNGGNVLLSCYPATENQVLKAFSRYYRKHELVPYAGWEIKGIYDSAVAWEGSSDSLENFNNPRQFSSVKEYVHAVKESYKKEGLKLRWHAKHIIISYPKITLKFPVFVQYPVSGTAESILQADESIDEADGCTTEPDWKELKETHKMILITQFKADNGISFTEGEFFIKLHNRLAGRLQDGETFRRYSLRRTDSHKGVPEFEFTINGH